MRSQWNSHFLASTTHRSWEFNRGQDVVACMWDEGDRKDAQRRKGKLEDNIFICPDTRHVFYKLVSHIQ